MSLIRSSSERSERSVLFEPNLRSERVRYVSERETNVQALTVRLTINRLILDSMITQPN